VVQGGLIGARGKRKSPEQGNDNIVNMAALGAIIVDSLLLESEWAGGIDARWHLRDTSLIISRTINRERDRAAPSINGLSLGGKTFS